MVTSLSEIPQIAQSPAQSLGVAERQRVVEPGFGVEQRLVDVGAAELVVGVDPGLLDLAGVDLDDEPGGTEAAGAGAEHDRLAAQPQREPRARP